MRNRASESTVLMSHPDAVDDLSDTSHRIRAAQSILRVRALLTSEPETRVDIARALALLSEVDGG